MVTISLIVAIYYNVIMSYTLFFTFASFQGGAIAPWAECNTGERDKISAVTFLVFGVFRFFLLYSE